MAWKKMRKEKELTAVPYPIRNTFFINSANHSTHQQISLVVASGYYLVKIEPEDIEKTAFLFW